VHGTLTSKIITWVDINNKGNLNNYFCEILFAEALRVLLNIILIKKNPTAISCVLKVDANEVFFCQYERLKLISQKQNNRMRSIITVDITSSRHNTNANFGLR